jgi:Na+-translocating ferredoxin:NAD+ oxidoreductase RnfG subunit
MRRWQFTLLMIVAVACVCLTLVSVVFARQNQKLQAAVQAQQTSINKGALSQQIGGNLLREMGAVAQTDDKMKELLKDNGYNLSSKSSTTP